jgi:hypothetical protein
MWHVVLLGLGVIMFVLGLLTAGHAPFQYWRYSSQWHNPDRKGPVDVNSEDYKISIASMKMMGGGLITGGGLLIAMALSDLGLIH